jgi:hypothetical protein
LTFPVIIDRSLSCYILGSLSKYDHPVSIEELRLIIAKNFNDMHQLEKRLAEQLATGSVHIDKDKKTIVLTEKGNRIVKINIFFGKLFNLDLNNILPEVNE